MTTRRTFVAATAACLSTYATRATAQKVYRIGYLSLRSGPNETLDAFAGMRDLGYIEGRALRNRAASRFRRTCLRAPKR